MYQIKIRHTTEGNFETITKGHKDLKEVFSFLEQVDDLEEVYLKYYEFERELN